MKIRFTPREVAEAIALYARHVIGLPVTNWDMATVRFSSEKLVDNRVEVTAEIEFDGQEKPGEE